KASLPRSNAPLSQRVDKREDLAAIAASDSCRNSAFLFIKSTHQGVVAMVIQHRARRALAVAVFAGAAGFLGNFARADVKLPAIFAEHMVLQQGMPVPVWGTADAGEEVTVSFGDQKQS